MDKTVERYAGHYMNKQTGDFIEAVEYHRVPPHGYGDRIVSECQTISTDEEPFRIREEPDCAHTQEVDKVAEICQEVVVASSVVGIVSNGHEVENLSRVPDVEIFRISSDQISTNE